MMPITISAFAPAHLEAASALSRQVGWPHRIEDWDLVRSISRGWVALEGERVVGTAFLTPYGPRLGAANMIIVDKSMRGRGIGKRLMEALLDARENRALHLVATESGRPLYEALGFVAVGEIGQHQGPVGRVPAPPGVERAGPDSLRKIVEIDRIATGGERDALLARLMELGRAAVIREDGRIVAAAFRRKFGRGEVIGPVIAHTAEQARALVAHHCAGRDGAFLRIDVPRSADMESWLDSIGLARSGGGLVMRLGAAPLPLPQGGLSIHALASQALG